MRGQCNLSGKRRISWVVPFLPPQPPFFRSSTECHQPQSLCESLGFNLLLLLANIILPLVPEVQVCIAVLMGKGSNIQEIWYNKCVMEDCLQLAKVGTLPLENARFVVGHTTITSVLCTWIKIFNWVFTGHFSTGLVPHFVHRLNAHKFQSNCKNSISRL